MLIKTAVLALVMLLTGCASQCQHSCVLGWGPGSPSFDAIALAHDRADPCQAGTTPERRVQLGRPDGYQRPDWCFSGRGYQRPVYIYNNTGQRIATVK
jgi:hypothetical protein